MIGRSGERGSGISALAARHDDDDDDYGLEHSFRIHSFKPGQPYLIIEVFFNHLVTVL